MAAVVTLVAIGLLMGLIIGIVSKFFAVAHDPRLEELAELLPGSNCGACGFAGCADFARALNEGRANPGQCPSSSPEQVNRIAALLGVEVESSARMVAVVRCGGDQANAKATDYNGVLNCRSAALVTGGPKHCDYGCLGMASCARACPFGAIEMTPGGLAVVHPQICTGCQKCVAVCPRQLIAMAPKSAELHNFCNSPEKGSYTSKVCKVSCIGCQKCVKAAEPGQITMHGFLARVNYDNPPVAAIAAVCPTKCLRPAMPVTAATSSVASGESEIGNG